MENPMNAKKRSAEASTHPVYNPKLAAAGTAKWEVESSQLTAVLDEILNGTFGQTEAEYSSRAKHFDLFRSHYLEQDRLVHQGISVNLFYKMAEALGQSSSKLSEILGLAPATMARRRSKGQPLKPVEGDKVLQLLRVYQAASSVFNNPKEATTWLTSPVYSLGNKKPLDLVATSAGTEAVLDFIDGLEYGNFA
ncbi:MAG: putative toxin-antitoxin system antitoxin component (TIGR02293 family) [Gammaproteobacteria bacterium]|jgi:putative toxin-antitoxin system antitoxin component (TIGR02293 family)